MTGIGRHRCKQKQTSALTAALTHRSTLREKMVEHMFLGELGAELLARGIDYDVLHAEIDKQGYDVLIEAGGFSRHIQLKSIVLGGARKDITVSQRLVAKPSACVVWLTFDLRERRICGIRWFGDKPGRPLPDPGSRIARHTRANSAGVKAERSDHRVVPQRRFEQIADMSHLADQLFGTLAADPLTWLRSRIRRDLPIDETWIAALSFGDFSAVPHDLAWTDSAQLGHAIDGYRLLDLISDCSPTDYLEQQRAAQLANGTWPGDAATLWTTLFLEWRADHFGANDQACRPELDQLCQQLRTALIELEAAHA